MEELGLQQYGSMLLQLGRLDLEQGRYKEALVIYKQGQGRVGPAQGREAYGMLLTDMGICHEKLLQWGKVVACYKEDVEHSRILHGNNHPEYAITLNNLARLFASLKQCEEAILRLEEVLAIFRRVYGDQHGHTVETVNKLTEVRQLAAQIRSWCDRCGHNFCMCSCCSAVSEAIPAFARGTAMPTASCSTGQRTSHTALCAFSAAQF
jgi:tetratricopeptide (TPR) repeat protein